MLRLDNVSKKYVLPGGRVVAALDRISIDLANGDFAIVVGANGAGKSTLFDLIVGRSLCDEGRILIGDVDMTGMSAHRKSRYVTLIDQSRGAGLPKALTVREVMRLAIESNGNRRASRRDMPMSERLDRLEPGLSRVLGSQLWHLSGGEYQLVALSVAAIQCENNSGKHLLLLDEHVSQLAPGARDRVLAATTALIRERNLTTILATHSPSIAAVLGSRQIVLNKGRIHTDLAGDRRIGDPNALRRLLVEIAAGDQEHGDSQTAETASRGSPAA